MPYLLSTDLKMNNLCFSYFPESLIKTPHSRLYKNKSSFFVRLGYEDLRIVDPDRAPGLYPFMVAASGNTNDLSAVNCLLVRRDSSLAYEGERIDHSNTHKCKRRREGVVIKIEQDE